MNVHVNKKSLSPSELCKMVSEQHTNLDRYHIENNIGNINKYSTLSIEDIIKNSEIVLKSYNIKYISNNYSISFKLNNWFCIISKIEDNSAFRFFKQINPWIISVSLEKLSMIYWEDEEVEYNLLNTETLHNLFKSLYEYKNYIFEDLTLNDLYFSKKYNRFIIKDLKRILPTYSSKLKVLEYFPENILFDKNMFVLGEQPISFEDLLQFSDLKKILK